MKETRYAIDATNDFKIGSLYRQIKFVFRKYLTSKKIPQFAFISEIYLQIKKGFCRLDKAKAISNN